MAEQVDPKKALADAQSAVAAAYTPSFWKSFAQRCEARALEFAADVTGSPQAGQFVHDLSANAMNAFNALGEAKCPPLEVVMPLVSKMESSLLGKEDQAFQVLVQKLQAAADAADKAAGVAPSSSPVAQAAAEEVVAQGTPDRLTVLEQKLDALISRL